MANAPTCGPPQFKRLITEEKFEEATEIARAQVKSGAHIIDINLENTDRDELVDIDRFYEEVTQGQSAVHDRHDESQVDRACATYCLGKSIINSINFEDGEEKFEHVLPLVKKYGAAIVIGSIDEDKQQAQAITRERKLAIAQRARDYCVKHGIAQEDIIFDPLVFPCATGDENYIGSAVETIEGVRLIKAAFAEMQNGSWREQCQLRSAGGGPRGHQFRVPLSCDEGRARSGDRQCREIGALRHDSGAGTEGRRGFVVLVERGDDPIAARLPRNNLEAVKFIPRRDA